MKSKCIHQLSKKQKEAVKDGKVTKKLLWNMLRKEGYVMVATNGLLSYSYMLPAYMSVSFANIVMYIQYLTSISDV